MEPVFTWGTPCNITSYEDPIYTGKSEFKVTVFMRCTLMDGQYSPLQEVLTRGDMVQKKTFSFFLKEGNVCKFAAVSNSDETNASCFEKNL